MKARSVLLGSMSEICAKARIIMLRLQGEGVPISSDEAEIKMSELERQMAECSSEFERLFAR